MKTWRNKEKKKEKLLCTLQNRLKKEKI